MVDVVIVNWNAGQQLQEAVESVLACGAPHVSQVVIVDNGSGDGSADFAEQIPGVRLIRSAENLGFGKACNLGAAQLTGEYVLFLNPDARLFPEALEKALEFMGRKENARVGICGVQLVEEDGSIARSCARFPSLTSFLADATGLSRLIPSLGHFMVEWDHASTRLVDQVIGAFFLVRRPLFERLGGFDERFFVYFEEVDFSYRARQLGLASAYLADARAFHAGGGTSRQVKATRLFYILRSRILYVFKHFNPLAASAVLLSTLSLELGSRCLWGVVKGGAGALRETLAGYGRLLRWLPDWLGKGTAR